MHKLLIASLIIVLAVTSALMVLPQAKALPQVRTLTLSTAPQSNNVLASGPPDSGDGIVVATAPENAPLVSAFGVGTILVGQAVSNGKIAFVSNRDGNNEIYTMNVDSTGVARLTVNVASDVNPTWSPDGTKIAFVSNRDGNYEIYIMNTDGTGATRLTSNAASDALPTWSHDGTKIAFERGYFTTAGQIYVLDADSCHECIGTPPTNLSQSASSNTTPDWSPDGTKIVFATNRDGNYELYIINPDGTGVTRLTSNTVSDREPSWQPISVTPLPGISINDVTLPEGGSGTKSFDFTVTRSGDTSGTSSVNFATADGTATVANSDYVANSGTLSFAAGETTKTITIVVNGDTTVEPDETFTVNLSNCVGCIITDSHGVGTILVGQAVSNGKIAFVSNRDGNNEIYTMNVDSTGVARLTVNVASDVNPTWSPDGTKIAFVSNRDGNNEIYTMNADGTGVTRLTTSTSDDSSPAWSPDGSKIAFQTNRDSFSNPEIYVMNVDGSGQTRLTVNTFSDLTPAWSPNGTKIAFSTNRDGNFEIYTMNADGTGATRLTSNPALDANPTWSHDGTKIAFVRGGFGSEQ